MRIFHLHKLQRRHLLQARDRLARSAMPEFALAFTLVSGRYLANSDFSYPTEILVPTVLFGVFGSVLYYVLRRLLHRSFTAHIAALVAVYGVYAYSYAPEWIRQSVSGALPAGIETDATRAGLYVIGLVVLSTIVALGVTRITGLQRVQGLQIPKVVLFLLAFVFVSQLYKVGTQIAQIYPQLTYSYEDAALQKRTGAQTTKPDVYYIVFDRYASNQTLADRYDYDNTALTSFLASEGFVTRTDAYANYPFTMSSISSTLAMNYHTQLKQFADDSFQTGFPYRSVLQRSLASRTFQAEGYDYNQISSWWDFSRTDIAADTQPTLSFRLRVANQDRYLSDMERDIINKSAFAPLLKKGISVGGLTIARYDLARNPRQNFEAQMRALTDIASRTDRSKPQFTFAHVLLPHDPYIYMPDGSEPTYDSARTDNGADETRKYINQLQYANKRIMTLVASIRSSSPDAAIIIQADEGPYPKQFRGELTPKNYYNPKSLPVAEMRQKFGILASYYMPGIDQATVARDITASVNPLRFVLDHYVGYNLPPLPDCHFASGNKFNVFSFTDVGQTLTGRPSNWQCANL